MDLKINILVMYEKDGGMWKWCVHTDHDAKRYEDAEHVPLPKDSRRWGTTYTKWGAKRQVARVIEKIRTGAIEGYQERLNLTMIDKTTPDSEKE